MEKGITKILTLIIVLSCCTGVLPVSAKSNSATPIVAVNFARDINELQALSINNVSRATELKQNIQGYFAHNGVKIDDEFSMVGVTRKDGRISPNTYCSYLKKYIFTNHSVSMTCGIIGTYANKAPDYGKQEITCYTTRFKKVIKYGGKFYTIWQEADIDPVIGKITKIVTSFKTPYKNDYLEDRVFECPDDYLKYAAKKYTRKSYTEAYETYKQLTENYPYEPEGWYRLAIMTFKKQGCNPSKPVTQAIEYMKRAYGLSGGKLRQKADHILFSWRHLNYM